MLETIHNANRLVWSVSDTLNALMAIPNLVSVLISLPLLRRLHQEYFASPKTDGRV